MNNPLKIIITTILIVAANIATHYWPQWTDQVFMVWLVAVLLTVTWERWRPDYTSAYIGAREDMHIWRRRALEAEALCRDRDEQLNRLCEDLNAENGPTHMGEPVLPGRGE